MPFTQIAAQKLARQHELSLLDASFSLDLAAMPLPRLNQNIARTHRLRAKYRDIAEQQRGEALGKRDPTGTRPAEGNENTVAKETIFAEATARFEEELAKRTPPVPDHERPDRVARVARAAASTARASAIASARSSESTHSISARAAMRAATQGEVAHIAHASVRGRHVQARRDQPRGGR